MRRITVGLVAWLWVAAINAGEPTKVLLDVENMTCPACAITIGIALDKVPGVTDKRIDAGTETVTVTFDPERTSVAAVAKAVTEAGFPAKARADDR